MFFFLKMKGKIITTKIEDLFPPPDEVEKFLERYGSIELSAEQKLQELDEIKDVFKEETQSSVLRYQRLEGPFNLVYSIEYIFDINNEHHWVPGGTRLVYNYVVGSYVKKWTANQCLGFQERVKEILEEGLHNLAHVEDITLHRVKIWKNGKNRSPFLKISLILNGIKTLPECKVLTKLIKKRLSPHTNSIRVS